MMLSLLSPMAVQTIHAMDGHAHEICSDISTHIHKKDLDCSIDLFHFASFDFKPFDIEVGFDAIYVGTCPDISYSHFTSKTKFSNHLRGPPARRSTH